ncbi:hypothetical protein HaLaN_20425 [Haematococcus lacustris]|uniref:Uncharacterized protein n=1 Tax=Haematococcus lacustris TaxID=44745 RepID=A0A699ZVW1_HAELA|nr:hypothetical protein HaLaN_20425 [Haematococcus lacustris]
MLGPRDCVTFCSSTLQAAARSSVKHASWSERLSGTVCRLAAGRVIHWAMVPSLAMMPSTVLHSRQARSSIVSQHTNQLTSHTAQAGKKARQARSPSRLHEHSSTLMRPDSCSLQAAGSYIERHACPASMPASRQHETDMSDGACGCRHHHHYMEAGVLGGCQQCVHMLHPPPISIRNLKGGQLVRWVAMWLCCTYMLHLQPRPPRRVSGGTCGRRRLLANTVLTSSERTQ